jgi:hypothetical protein
MSAIKFIQGVARKSLTKNQGSGITTIPGAMQSEAKAAEIVALLQKAGIPMNQLDDFIRSEADVLKFLNIIESASKPKVYSGQAAIDQLNKIFPKKGEVIEFPQKTSFKEQVEAMKKSGDIVDPNNLKKNDKVLQRDMFNNSNLNKTDTVTDTITYIKTLEPVKAMKEANSIIARKGKYKDLTPEQSKRILQDTEDHIFQRDPDNLYDYDPEDMAKGGRAGYAVGNQVMPEVDARMKNTYEQNIKLNQIQRNMQDRVRKGSKTQGLEIGQLTEGMYGKPKTEYNLNNPNLKFNEAQSYGAASNMGLRPEQIKAVAYYNTLRNNFGDEGMMAPQIAPPMFNQGQAVSTPMGGGLAGLTGVAPGTSPFAAEKFFKTPAEQFAQYQEGLRRSMMLNPNSGIYFDPKATYDAGDYISPEGIYTFSEPDPNASRGMMVDGTEYSSEQDAIDDMGIERYNQFMSKGGRAGFYQGGQAQIEPDLSDIGHGSDALMARNRLLTPGSQATTSTGLSYLLGEDNDTTRVPYNEGLKVEGPDPRILELMLNEKMSYEDAVKEFEKRQKQQPYIDERMGTGPGPILEAAEGGRIGFAGGGDPKRRAFLKLMASLTGGAAAFKSGLLSLGEGGTKKAVTETVKQAAGSGGQVPPYFLNLVKKIKNLGDDVTQKAATQDRQVVKQYKDFEMTEDITTGEIQIFKKSQSDEAINRFGGENATEEVFMRYKPSETIIGKNNKPVKTGPEYEENTSYISNNRENTGGILDDVDGVPDEVVQEGTVFEDTLSEFGKADGGRIGFSGGGIFRAIIAKSAAKKGLSVTDFIKATNYKGLPPEIRMYISPEDFAKLKGGQKEMYDNYIDMAKTRLEFQKNVEGGMKTPEVAPFFKNLEKTMDEQSFVPKTVTADDIAEMELMVKNRFNKGRKDNAQGGIQTMLGE